MRRLFVMAAIVMAMAAPAAVSAAVPDNDLPGGAIVLGTALPQTIEQDTTEATVSTDDVGCGAGGVDQATVWYAYSPSADGDLQIDASGTDYFVGINVFAGSADAGSLIGCFGTSGTVSLEAGTTYFLMFADADEDGTNGGSLRVVLDVAPPPLEVSLTIDPSGHVDRNGLATVSGTLACSRAADFAEVGIELSQNLGRFRIHGSSFAVTTCSTTPTAWVALISGENGKFGSGNATVNASAFACDLFGCGGTSTQASLRLRR